MATPRRPIKRRSTTFAPVREGSVENAARRLIHEYSEDGVEVIEVDGALRCGCVGFIGKSWCNHLQHAIVTSLDAMPSGPISAHVEFVKYPDHMLIPIFPTKGTRDSGFQVVLIGPVEDDGSRAVRLADCMNELNDPELLGWIFPGEGRHVIRSMILEWVRGQYQSTTACKSPVHKNYNWSKGDKRADPLESRELLDLFTLVKYGECSSCHQFSDANADAPDL
jgi:hypothetical protein